MRSVRRPFRLGALLAPLCWGALEGTSRAAEPTAAKAPNPTLTRPVAKGPLDVAYPEGASGEGRVTLELVLDEHGTVTGVSVLAGDEPFATAAESAARSFQFEPARRGDLAVSAKIRVEVVFTPPPAPEPVEEPPSATAAPVAVAPKPAARAPKARVATGETEAVEITVQGDRPEPATQSFGRAEVRQLPGTFGDPFRAIEVMPGVVPIATGVPFFFVRGSPPGNVGYFLDGIRVPLLYHAALGPSVIHPGLVERVDLYSGGYPARYGRFAGGIVAAETTEPHGPLHGEASIRIFDAGLLAEAPFANGRGTALVAGRYSYTAAILSLIAPEVELAYWDYQGRFYYNLSRELRVGVFAFGAYDKFLAEDDEGELQGAATQFHRVDLRAEYHPTAATEARLAITLGSDLTESPGDDGEAATTLRDRLFGARVLLDHRVSPELELRSGADVAVDQYRITFGGAFENNQHRREVFGTRRDLATGLWADAVWEFAPGMRVTPGVRLDVYASRGTALLAIDPRISASFAVHERVTLEHTFGVARQPPSFVVPIPGFQLSDLEDGLQRSLQSSAGVIVRPGRSWQLNATAFHNVFLNLTDSLGSELARDDAELTGDRQNEPDSRVLGQAYGLELSARRPLTEHLAGYFAYTLSRSIRSYGGAKAVAAFDRPHVLHAAGAYDLGRRWRAGARLTAYSGMPAEREGEQRRFDNEPDSGRFGNDNDSGISNGEPDTRPRGKFDRAPPFFRLDLRLEKNWLIGSQGANLSLVAELLNATMSREVLEYECRPAGCSGDVIGPVTIPSLGVEGFF